MMSVTNQNSEDIVANLYATIFPQWLHQLILYGSWNYDKYFCLFVIKTLKFKENQNFKNAKIQIHIKKA